MLNYLYKYTIFMVIFTIIINFNFISYSKTIEPLPYKIETNISSDFSVKNNFDNIGNALRDENFFNQSLTGLFISIPIHFVALPATTLFTVLVAIFMNAVGMHDYTTNLLPLTSLLLSYIIINSFSVFVTGENKYYERFPVDLNTDKFKHSYWQTLLGSVIGAFTFILLCNSLIFLESYLRPESDYSEIAKNQWLINSIFIPIFASFTATLFYKLSKTPNAQDNKELNEKDLKEIEQKAFNEYKNFTDRIMVTNKNISFIIAQF